MTDLSILIPSRNEMLLARTIQDILANLRGETEIIAVLDGTWADPPIEDHPNVTLVYQPNPIGQRAACNAAARIAQGKYVMKVDAHCAFDEGFDVKLMENMEDDMTVVPVMRNLHAFDWICPEGHRRYQGPSDNEKEDPLSLDQIGKCRECGKPSKIEIVWIPKRSPSSRCYCFDPSPHFQYFQEFSKRPEGQGDLTPTMSLQGSCWMLTREKYFELDVCDEGWGIWGSQGIEVACKTWLSGGRVMVNHNTWYAHMFRTQGGDFGFPYPLSGNQVGHAKSTARKLFFENNWEKQVRPLSWLVEKFWPVPGWTEENLAEIKKYDDRVNGSKKVANIRKPVASPAVVKTATKGIAYYSDSQLDPNILLACQKQLVTAANGIPIVSATLKRMDFGVKNIHFPSFKRSPEAMFKQIYAALEHSSADIIFFAEHDILYHPCHFLFVPPDRTKIYYNQNLWNVRYSDGHAVYYEAKRVSQICAYRDVLLEHYRKRIERVERDGFSMSIGFEPGSHHREARIDDLQSDIWISEYPNIDIKHGNNFTPARWSQDQFRDRRNCQGWMEADEIPGWGSSLRLVEEIGNANAVLGIWSNA